MILKNKTIIFYDLTERKIKSIKNKNSIKIKSLVQNSYGNLLAIDKNKLYVSKINVEQIETIDNKKKDTKYKIFVDFEPLFWCLDHRYLSKVSNGV